MYRCVRGGRVQDLLLLRSHFYLSSCSIKVHTEHRCSSTVTRSTGSCLVIKSSCPEGLEHTEKSRVSLIYGGRLHHQKKGAKKNQDLELVQLTSHNRTTSFCHHLSKPSQQQQRWTMSRTSARGQFVSPVDLCCSGFTSKVVKMFWLILYSPVKPHPQSLT